MLALLTTTLLALAPSPRQSAWERFPTFLWAERPGASELVRAFGGACVTRLDEARQLRELGLDYFVFNAPGRDDLHLDRESPSHAERWTRWYETRDPALLVREPCLTSEATRARMARQLDESLRARGGRHGLGLSLGDEVGLTPGGAPEDVCQCADCEAAWKAFAGARGVELTLAAISTDATRLRVADGDTTALGPWLLRRRFHQDVLLDAFDALGRLARERAGATPVGLLGIAGQSAFGGVAVERVLPSLDFFECYRTGNARELALTLREPRQRALATVFVDARGPEFTAAQAWEHWLRGGDGLVVWSEADLRRAPEQRERLLRAIAEIRGVQSRLGRYLPRPQGIALVHSHPSLAASWMREALLDGATWPRRFQSWQEQHGAFERARREWFERAEDADLMPGALPLDQVGAAAVARFPLLVFQQLLVFDDDDLSRAASYLAAGGRIWVSGELGWIDSHGRRPEHERFEQLRALSDRCRRAPSDFASAEVERAPFEIGPAGARWIATWQRAGDGWVCAAQRRIESPEACAPFQPTIRVGPGLRVEWLHPEPGADGVVNLPAGDAAVFRLRPPQ